MKALSLTQPWASLVAIGTKKIETRSWQVSYRGWLAIHAAKGFPLQARLLCNPLQPGPNGLDVDSPFWRALKQRGYYGPDQLPLGALVAVAHLHAVGVIGRRADGAVTVRTQELPVTAEELSFGDFTPGRYGWVLTNVQRLPKPIPCRGTPCLWNVPPDVWAQVEKQLSNLLTSGAKA
ncbi:MAG: ASCH domain-containing protein [Chloroflexota bacterium]